MNLKHIMIVFKKEVKDILRDRRTLISSILVPLILMPILFLFVGGSTEQMTREMTENITIAQTKASYSEAAQDFLLNYVAAQDSNIILTDPVDDAWQAINDKQVKLVVEIDSDFEAKLKESVPFTLKILYDNSQSRSGGAAGTLESAIHKVNGAIAQKRLEALNVDPQILTPVSIEMENIAKTGDGNLFLMMVLPMLITMLVAVGGIPAATDLVAGEKERMTFEPLLTTRPSRLSILVGKYLTINVFSLASVISTLGGMLIAYLINPSSLSMGSGSIGGFNIELGAVLLSLLVAILLGMTFSGLQLVISTYARSFKEGQTYLSMLILVVIIPAYATMMVMPNDIQSYMFLLPVMNTISAFKLVLGGISNYSGLIMACVSSVVYVILSLMAAAWMFKQEKYMFRS